MKRLILTCKHHDGFCLWPSEFTEHSVKNTPWENGNGDMVRDFATACQNHGLQFGVYLSPWDGANGGDGYYGVARETRKIERGTYYDWNTTAEIVRELQPNAVIFSDAGPDVRWIGNEHGIAGDPCWATYSPVVRAGESKVGPGTTKSELGQEGHRDGALWLPGEADVSIRPGWFYHAIQDNQVRGGAVDFSPAQLLDGDRSTFWCTDDSNKSAQLVVQLSEPLSFNIVDLREYLPLGHRVDQWALDAWQEAAWVEFAKGQSIGNRRLWRGEKRITTKQVRLRLSGAACPAISEFGIYLEPNLPLH